MNVTDENFNVQPWSDHDISLDKRSRARTENQASDLNSEINSATSSLSIPLDASFTSDDFSCDIDDSLS